MSIFLTILKVIGIILAVLLGIIVGLFLIVLFLPICYKVQGQLEPKNNEILAKCSWLLSLVQINVLAKGVDIKVWLSICGFKKQFYPMEEDAKEASKEETDTEIISEEETTIQAAEVLPELKEQKESKEFEVELQESVDDIQEPVIVETEPKTTSDKEAEQGGKSLQKYLPWNMIKAWSSKVKNLFSSIKEKIAVIKRELSDETNKNAISHIFRELKALLHYFGPRRGKADLRYATGDPALTGQITGCLSICPICYKKGVRIIPDFEADKLYVQGNFRVHGHIQLFHLVGTAFRLYRDKNIKKIIQKFK